MTPSMKAIPTTAPVMIPTAAATTSTRTNVTSAAPGPEDREHAR